VSIGLWVIQALLAALFVVMGGMKLVMPAEELTAQSPFPEMFMRFIGTCEVLGAFGLILPGVLRLWTGLTPLAAAGLAIIMGGATVVTVGSMGMTAALLPLVAGLLSAFVVFGRWKLEPLHDRTTVYDRRSTESLTHSMSR
jgi:hypothetical protein